MHKKVFVFSFLLFITLLSVSPVKKISQTTSVAKESPKSFRYLKEENYLEITDINLKQKFYELKSKKNNIDKNIELLYQDDLNFIIVAHSGSGALAYFNEIDKLKMNAKARIHYEGLDYIYELNDIKKIYKLNENSIELKKSESNLVLISCDKTEKDKFLKLSFYLQK